MSTSNQVIVFQTALLLAIPTSYCYAENWPQFRGADSRGVVEGSTNLPETWSASENVEWKTDIPGRGWSSPVATERDAGGPPPSCSRCSPAGERASRVECR